MRKLSDQQVIEQLKSEKYRDNEEAMTFLYQQLYRKVVRYVQKNQGSEQDADDVFQDGLVALCKMSKTDRLEQVSNIQAYLFSACRNLWLKTLKKRQNTTELTEQHHELAEEASQIHQLQAEEKKRLIDRLLSSLGESCKKILIYYYYDRLKMKEIMPLMNFASEQVAKNKKSTCMKKLKEIIKDNPDLKELLV